MFDWAWIGTDPSTLSMMLITSVGIYAALLGLTRLAGLRSFSKMSSFDFAVTVAMGSIVASTVLAQTPSLLAGAFGLALLYGIQWLVSRLRRDKAAVEHLVDNEPLLVMAGEQVLEDHLDMARMTEDDLRSKLRMAGITHPKQVLAVVFETTGDVSVIRRDEDSDVWLFADVRGAEHLQPIVSMEPQSDLEHT